MYVCVCRAALVSRDAIAVMGNIGGNSAAGCVISMHRLAKAFHG